MIIVFNIFIIKTQANVLIIGSKKNRQQQLLHIAVAPTTQIGQLFDSCQILHNEIQKVESVIVRTPFPTQSTVNWTAHFPVYNLLIYPVGVTAL